MWWLKKLEDSHFKLLPSRSGSLIVIHSVDPWLLMTFHVLFRLSYFFSTDCSTDSSTIIRCIVCVDIDTIEKKFVFVKTVLYALLYITELYFVFELFFLYHRHTILHFLSCLLHWGNDLCYIVSLQGQKLCANIAIMIAHPFCQQLHAVNLFNISRIPISKWKLNPRFSSCFLFTSIYFIRFFLFWHRCLCDDIAPAQICISFHFPCN